MAGSRKVAAFLLVVAFAGCAALGQQPASITDDSDEDNDAQVDNALKIADQDTHGVTDSTIQNLKLKDPEVAYAQQNLQQDILNHIRQKKNLHQEVAEPKEAHAEMDPEVAYAEKKETQADAEPKEAYAEMDPEVAYAEKKETQADASMVEKVPKDDVAKKTETKAKPAPKAQVSADAKNAHIAAATAKEAAKVATNVAHHSIKITEHAKSALGNAQEALNRARVETEGLSKGQKKSLKEAERQLKEATKDAEYGVVKDASYVKAEVENKPLKKLVKKMDEEKKKEKKKPVDNSSELDAMHKELEALRKKLKEMQGDDADDQTIKDLEKQIDDMAKAEKKEDKVDSKSHDEMKAEIEKLRQQLEDAAKEPEEKTHKLPKATPVPDDSDGEASPVATSKSIDIDTAMPYGDLEPFGREDTAQELTEGSIKESDSMVDQLERAEVAEEKRAVFRALTRLRGAAITSFDGVARSQTGNIDEYNKIHQWRTAHPLHHLADEESDVAKWAFPDNAD